MQKIVQRALLVAGLIALLFLLVEIAFSVAATTHSNTPARVAHINAGPYALTVNLFTDPARAGFALPFSIATAHPNNLTFIVTSIPEPGVDATPIHASIIPDASGAQGTAEITVQGAWHLHIVIDGPAGRSMADVPITANALPAIPTWLGWLIGAIPLFGLIAFLLLQSDRRQTQEPAMAAK